VFEFVECYLLFTIIIWLQFDIIIIFPINFYLLNDRH
jgi:hypothetical protein